MAESYGEDAGSKAIELDSPIVNEEEEDDIGEEETEEMARARIGFNRSESCGSILQGNPVNRIKNLSRRVSFPSDDKLISGYNEARNPWEHVHETTTEELIQAYTQACQTWNIRPITKLLVQLQGIKDFSIRYSSLTLKGERLESRVVETLESIFKRVQFITIDLEATNLDEDTGAALFDMMEYYESAVNVLVGFNKNLGTRGWQAAAHMMRKMSCLRLFDGHSVPLSIQASPFVGRALRLSNTIVTLHLENAMLSGRPVLLIVAALRMNTTLRELFLADNRLSPLDALQLANLLKFNRILQLLDLRNNPIQDMGLGHLCAGLMAQSGSSGLNGSTDGLQTLVLWNNQISHESMSKLAMALRYTVSLSTLNLGQNVVGDDGILRLKEGLLQNHSLLRLGLVGTKLSDEGAVAIAEYLAESPRIIRLDLRNNGIKVAGLMALSLAFKINHSLLRLDIDKPTKKDSLKELAAKQESLMNDLVLYAQRNKQVALEKAQAIQKRQEEARLAQKEVNGLRYMDMTNSTTPTTSSTSVSTDTSINNSNNLTHRLEIPSEAFQKRIVRCIPSPKDVSPPEFRSFSADDSPEDSPEFLPRSSVPYHQVAPVMLSGSELAKRAAAAKLGPVPERLDESTPSSGRMAHQTGTEVTGAFGANVVMTSQIESKTSAMGRPLVVGSTQPDGNTMSVPENGSENGDSTPAFNLDNFAVELAKDAFREVVSRSSILVSNTSTRTSVYKRNTENIEQSESSLNIDMDNDLLTVEAEIDESMIGSDVILNSDLEVKGAPGAQKISAMVDQDPNALMERGSAEGGDLIPQKGESWVTFGGDDETIQRDIQNGNYDATLEFDRTQNGGDKQTTSTAKPHEDQSNNNQSMKDVVMDNGEHASRIVNDIFRDIGLFARAGESDVCNGNYRRENPSQYSEDDTSKFDNFKAKDDGSPVNIEVTHFDLSQFPGNA